MFRSPSNEKKINSVPKIIEGIFYIIKDFNLNLEWIILANV